MSETKRIAIIDKDGNNVLLTVRPTLDDPTKNGVVICNPDGSKIGGGSGGLTNPVSYIDFNTTLTISDQEGRLKWNMDDGCLEVGMPGGNVNLQIGLESFLPRRVKNTTGGDLTNGTFVYINGSDGTNPTVGVASNADTSSDSTIAMLTEDVANNQKGWATTFGIVRGLNTSAFSAGSLLYLGTSGGFTTTKPTSPNHTVKVGYVIRQHATQGEVFVTINTGGHLEDLHDVNLSGIQNNSKLRYDMASGLWEVYNENNFTISLNPVGNTLLTYTLDHYSGIILTGTSTTSSQTFQAPTDYYIGQKFTVVNSDSSTYDFDVDGTTISPGTYTEFMRDGDSFIVAGGGAIVVSSAGSDKQIQYNDGGVTAGAEVYYDKTKKSLGINTLPQAEYQLDIAGGGMSLLLGAENLSYQRRDNQIKYFRMGMPGYLSATNIGTIMFGTYSSSGYTLSIGGGTTFSKAANNINFWTTTTAEGSNSSGVLAMAISQSGKVGIGTPTPTQALDIAGSLGLQMTTTSTTGIIYKGSSRFIHNFSHPTGGGAIPTGYNLFIGEDAGNFTMGSTATNAAQASRNIGIGRNSLANITLGQENIAMGEYSGWSLTTGINNVILGRAAGFLISSGSNNTFVGYGAGNKIVTGSNNVVVGVANTSTGSNNTVVGSFSLYDTTTGGSMTSSMSIGYQCFRSVTGGSGNIGFGNNAGRFLADGTTQVTSFTDCFYVGNNTRPSAVTGLTNETVIGTNAIGNGSNTVTIGATTTTNNYLYGNIVTDGKLGLGIAPTSAIHLNKGEGYSGGIRFRSTDSYLYESSGYVFLASNGYDSIGCFSNAVNISLPTSLPSVGLTNSYIAYLSGSNLVFRVNVGGVLKSGSIALS